MRKGKKIIDISSEEKKQEVFKIFNSLSSKHQVHEYYGISDNTDGCKHLNQVAKEIGFDFSIYKERKKKPVRYCKQCGKEITSKWGKDFCCSRCAAIYNGARRPKFIHNKIDSTNKKKNSTAKLTKKDLYCANCGKKLEGQRIKYCSNDCRRESDKKKPKNSYKRVCESCGKEFQTHRKNVRFCSPQCQANETHRQAYMDFLNNNEKYCRGNYTPKSFKMEFLKDQNGVCSICGCKPEHNGKPLVFVLDHIDGDASNNKRENLRMICPNCDSQLDTFKSKNKNSTRRNYWKEHIIKEINKNN